MKLHAYAKGVSFTVADDNDEVIFNYTAKDEELAVDVARLLKAITELLEGEHHG